MNQKEFVKKVILENDNHEDQIELVSRGLMDGSCPFKGGPIQDERRARSYARSVISNYLKKDMDLNGGERYVPKTKRGPIYKNPEIKELSGVLKALKEHQGQEDLVKRVEDRINSLKEAEDREKGKSGMGLDEALEALKKLGVG